jgi:hypothetical protein
MNPADDTSSPVRATVPKVWKTPKWMQDEKINQHDLLDK